MAKLYNLARMTTATTGTGTVTLGVAVAPFLSFVNAGIADGETVSYSIIDGTSNSEIGTGVYTSSGTTLTRVVTKSTNSNAAISLSGSAQVLITPRAEDLQGPIRPGGRLTLVSATPVLSSDQTAVSTVYYALYRTDQVPIYDGTRWVAYTFTELSAAMASSSNWASGSVYDWFVINDAGVLRLATGPAWSSTTSRGTGAGTTELELKNGLWTNKVSMTARYGASSTTTTAANCGTYVGSMYCTAAGKTDMTFHPATAAGGNNTFLALWNAYNRELVTAWSRDSGSNWSYTTATWRSANNSASMRVSWLDGLQQSHVDATYSSVAQSTNSACSIGVAIDGTGTPGGIQSWTSDGVGGAAGALGVCSQSPLLGLHYAQGVENGGGGPGAAFGNNVNSGPGAQGVQVRLMM